ncbi:MAG: DUF4854 domain-containing protein [Lachnospiraceae bacterium]|nr:DUF4854 domain-containing protein [Lachnospiraceae bacterium]
MKKRLLFTVCALSAMMLSGCGLFVSQEEMDSVIAERDYYMEEYDAAVEEQESFETEVEDLEGQVSDLEDANEALSSEITDLEAQIEEMLKITLEDFFEDSPQYANAMNAQMELYKETEADTYSDLGWKVEENTLTFWYQIKEQIPNADEAWDIMKEYIDTNQLAGMIEDLEEETGVEGIVVQYIYYNADGSEIGTLTYPEE